MIKIPEITTPHPIPIWLSEWIYNIKNSSNQSCFISSNMQVVNPGDTVTKIKFDDKLSFTVIDDAATVNYAKFKISESDLEDLLNEN